MATSTRYWTGRICNVSCSSSSVRICDIAHNFDDVQSQSSAFYLIRIWNDFKKKIFFWEKILEKVGKEEHNENEDKKNAELKYLNFN